MSSETWKVRNKYGHDRFVPSVGVFEADEVKELPKEVAEGLVSQSTWERVDGEKTEKKPAAKD